MRLDSALDLQARVFQRVFDFQPFPEASRRGRTGLEALVDPVAFEAEPVRARARKTEKQRTAEDIALGVSEGARDGDVKLAVLVQNPRKVRSAVVDDIVRMGRDEVEVIYIGRQRASWTLTRVDPILIGSSVFPLTRPGAGTLGCFCREIGVAGDCILSNNHVLADVNVAPIGGRITQPGGFDGGTGGADDIAELVRFIPMTFDGTPNLVDAAFARLVDHGRGMNMHDLFDASTPPVKQMSIVPGPGVPATLGLSVHKTGRKTTFTNGRVRAVNVNNYRVRYRGERVASFNDQITIETTEPPQPFSRKGDSGSLILDDEGNPVALLFAGSESGGAGNVGITGATPIGTVLAELGIEII